MGDLYLIDGDLLNDIADNINTVNERPATVTIENLSVTKNNTYTAPSGKAYGQVTVNVEGGGYPKPSYLISDGDMVSTFYFNKEYSNIDTFLASLTYSTLDPNTGLFICPLGFSYSSTLNNLFAVNLTGGEYAIVWNDGTITPIYATTAVPAFSVTTAGWQVEYFSPATSVTVDEDYINASFLAIMDNVVAKDNIAFGEYARFWVGTQIQYDALQTYDSSVLYCITGA